MNGSRLDPLSAMDKDSSYMGPDGDHTGVDDTLDLENTNFGINTHPDDDHYNSNSE